MKLKIAVRNSTKNTNYLLLFIWNLQTSFYMYYDLLIPSATSEMWWFHILLIICPFLHKSDKSLKSQLKKYMYIESLSSHNSFITKFCFTSGHNFSWYVLEFLYEYWSSHQQQRVLSTSENRCMLGKMDYLHKHFTQSVKLIKFHEINKKVTYLISEFQTAFKSNI